jgi:hyperosmotically inducible protein
MKRFAHIQIALLSAVLVCAGATAASSQAPAGSPVEDIRKALLKLPYYGVFDYLAFGYDKGTVTLAGYAYHPGLKTDAARAVKRVAGVDEVRNTIEDLPPLPSDDEIRWNTYYAIYRDSFLSKYAPGGGLLWGHRHVFPSGMHRFTTGPFPGMEPAGDYPIDIIVKSGRITLLGVVDNETDKNVAGIKAGGVPGTFGAVENDLIVEKSS